MNIRTILFDLDGTLIDTNDLIIASFTHTINEYSDRSYTRDEILDFIGPPLRESLEKINPERVEDMVETYRKHNIENHESYVRAYDGVVDTIRQLKEAGYRMGIVTTKMKNTVQMGLEITGLDGFFETIITLDDVTNAKPHPEPIVKALHALDSKASESLMVGDNTHDIEAGHNAGTHTAGVAWTVKGREVLEQLKPDYMLDHMSELLEITGG
ncbi:MULTISPECIES: pyrophosphatase PpaX [Halobacillus]|uniref:Pyrophosphatase PpaX n=1 Tax=Halobacillus halophilus (strain ATCC 35676 / DSM 2266 / JCM 20832 / KCTC 3685 / LMG 17431 / NBRC 102448 / NCIMB 2269) TaxID=866895 RepID=I0JQF7_HALH3|nr:pyrophosphatase PpaX [Halobacillus halophilus]ASF40394.1 pyrophosphatase PpaX [Halobacillus halophilus]CCG46377.1 pyrophosphatase PpaX [Halobacillus halophilus DSM 2266]